MKRKVGPAGIGVRFVLAAILLMFFASSTLFSQSFDFPSKKWGISFGNSKEFTGLRFNFRDSRVKRITDINVTLWPPKKDNEEARVNGLSLGVAAGGGYMHGVHLGVLGVGAEKNLAGFSVGLIGVGSGENVTGLNIGGLGVGAGEDLIGINIGGLGVGAGENLIGINIGVLGAGAGENMTGLNIGGLGVGAGENLIGINIGGLGAGAGEKSVGLTIGGLGVGAEEVQGITIGGLGVGGEVLKGIQLALGTVIVPRGGRMIGFSASAFNYIRGTQTGVTIGIVNYCWRLKGVQIGLVNIVRDNPKYSKVLPLINVNF